MSRKDYACDCIQEVPMGSRFRDRNSYSEEPQDLGSWMAGIPGELLVKTVARALACGEALTFGCNRKSTGISLSTFGASGSDRTWINDPMELLEVITELHDAYGRDLQKRGASSEVSARKAKPA